MKSYAELTANIAAVEQMGKWIAVSKMFGYEMSVAQGCIIAAECFITGMPLLEWKRNNHVISGNPTVPADAMAAKFQQAGGKIKLIEKSPNMAKAAFTWHDETYEIAVTWDEMAKEPTPYDGKEKDIVPKLLAGEKPKLKAKYATPRSRRSMLWARLISDSIRSIAPEVNFGTYTPEESEDMDDAPVVGGNPSSAAVVAPPSTVATAAGSSVASPAAAPTSSPSAPSIPNGASGVATNTTAAPSSAANQSPSDTLPLADDPRTSIRLDDPATELQKQQIIAAMQILAQEGVSDIKQKVKAKLDIHGINGILGLTIAEADKLYEALKVKQIEAWTNSALVGHVAKNNGSHTPPS